MIHLISAFAHASQTICSCVPSRKNEDLIIHQTSWKDFLEQLKNYFVCLKTQQIWYITQIIEQAFPRHNRRAVWTVAFPDDQILWKIVVSIIVAAKIENGNDSYLLMVFQNIMILKNDFNVFKMFYPHSTQRNFHSHSLGIANVTQRQALLLKFDKHSSLQFGWLYDLEKLSFEIEKTVIFLRQLYSLRCCNQIRFDWNVHFMFNGNSLWHLAAILKWLMF